MWDGERLHERMHRRAGPVRMAPGHVRCAGLELAFEEGEGVEVVSPHGTQHIWTRKQAGFPIRGTLLGRPFEGRGFVDDTAGYHARRTAWFWSAGVGRGAGGERIGWNLVEGVNDDPIDSERTVWVDGEPAEVAPVRFSADLARIDFADGAALEFRPWATLGHRTRLGLVRSDYRQPFGEFTGELPGGCLLYTSPSPRDRS